jgi:CIC family chloride channel protein
LVVIIIFIKVIATSLTIGAGGNGGIFAPTLFTGAFVGFGFAYFMHLSGIVDLKTANFVAAAMAGVLSGVLSAPLTGIFLIAEITGGYSLFIPLMIVSAMSFFIARHFEPYSVYTKILAQTKGWNRSNVDMILLDQISLKELIEDDFVTLSEGESANSIKDKVMFSKHNFFPVLDENGHLKGILFNHQLKNYLMQGQHDDMGWEYMIKPVKVQVEITENVDQVLKKLENTDVWHLPVIDNGVYKGFIFRSRILNMYRQLVKQNRQYF